jgi:hypothetical protein
MNFKAAMSKFLTNKLVLNIVSLIALFNVIGYMVMGHFNNVILFILIAVLVRYFSKNMIIVLGIPILFVNLLSLKGFRYEGMENNTNDKKVDSKEKKAETKKDAKQDEMIRKINYQKKSSQGLAMTPLDDTPTTDTQETFEAGRRKNRGSQIDYAATVEDAYDQLNSILGSDGIKRLTSDTQNLMKQQAQLAESMKGMAPLIEGIMPMAKQAQDMMKSMGGDGESGLGNIMDMAKKLSSNMSAAKAN